MKPRTRPPAKPSGTARSRDRSRRKPGKRAAGTSSSQSRADREPGPRGNQQAGRGEVMTGPGGAASPETC